MTCHLPNNGRLSSVNVAMPSSAINRRRRTLE